MKNSNSEYLEKVKKLTLWALVSDEALMGILVFKGGNALNLAYEITNRGSLDIDFSMEGDFSREELGRLKERIEPLLNQEFNRENITAFDVTLSEKPNILDESVKSFWGGYLLEFKTIDSDQYEKLDGNHDLIRRNAIPLQDNHSTKFTVDISKYEYVGKARPKDIEGATVFVYTPEMLALEKLRALCQQNLKYKNVVRRMTAKSRARDFYDIFKIQQSFNIDFLKKENIDLCKDIFAAKKVPMNYIKELPDQKDLHSYGWQSVLDTVNQEEDLEEFDFYFDFVIGLFSHLK